MLAWWLVLLELQFAHCILPVTPAIAKLCVRVLNPFSTPAHS